MMLHRMIPCLVFAVSLTAQPADESADSGVDRGVAAFKQGRYGEAVSAFEFASKLNPGSATVQMFLGTAYMVQWIPGAGDPRNGDFAAHAEAAFRAVLAIHPGDQAALMSLASLEFNRGKAINPSTGAIERTRHLAGSEAWYRQVIEADPMNKIAFYSLGVIAWERFYPELMTARAKLSMKPEDPGPIPDANIRAELRIWFAGPVEEGIANLNRALSIDPNYADGMAYLNLLHRERADLSDSIDEYNREIATADELVVRAMAARKETNEPSLSGHPGEPIEPQTTRVTAPHEPAESQASPQTPDRLRVRGTVQAANLLEKPDPIYPPLAMRARVQGVVRFAVIIGKDGYVQDIQLISGHPLLVPAATEAAKRYIYKPTLLNGQPVEVMTQIEVAFVLEN